MIQFEIKDIRFSNSASEVIHKIMKRYYLRGRHYDSIKDFEKHLQWAIEDYNAERPHYSLFGKTPTEIFAGDLPGLHHKKKLIKKTQQRRVSYNKNNGCRVCEKGLLHDQGCGAVAHPFEDRKKYSFRKEIVTEEKM